MNDVAIIGAGLHPFGRFEGKSAIRMGVDAIFAAQFFRLKANRYLHEHNISHRTLARVATKNFRNGADTLTAEQTQNRTVATFFVRLCVCARGEGRFHRAANRQPGSGGPQTARAGERLTHRYAVETGRPDNAAMIRRARAVMSAADCSGWCCHHCTNAETMCSQTIVAAERSSGSSRPTSASA